MKRIAFLFTGILLTISMIAFAKQIDEQTAKQVGQVFLSGKTDAKVQKSLDNLELVYKVGANSSGNHKSTEQTTYFYVFNAENGFVIVAGEDNVSPILGYSYENTFDPDNMPPNLIEWLKGYEEQIRYVIEQNVSATEQVQKEWNNYYNNTLPSVRKSGSVAPLVAAKWGQGSPYNAFCPGSGSNKSVTGCVATAMAIIMKYWSYPVVGSGSNSYTPPNYTSNPLSVDFGSTTYLWDSMPTTGVSTARQTQKDAVATLMYHCGVSVEMDYNTSAQGGSGAVTNGDYYPTAEYALKTFFGYKSTLKTVSKPSVTTQGWIDTLKNELDEGRPILYSGRNSSGTTGHAFVCDGYNEDGKFHFNWGWESSYDGYFALTALNPGTGGEGSGDGVYTYSQRAIIGIEPPEGIVNDTIKLRLSSFLNISALFQYIDDTISLKTAITNYDTNDFNGTLGAAIFNAMGILVDFLDTIPISLQGDTSSTEISFKKKGGAPFLPGNYTTYLLYKTANSDWTIVGDGGGYIKNYKEFRVVQSDNLQMHSTFSVTTGSLTTGKSVSISASVINRGTSNFDGRFRLSLYDLEGTHVQNIQIRTITNLPGVDSFYYFTTPTFTGTITAKPGMYLVSLEYQRNGEDTSVWKYVGNSTYNNPVFATITMDPDTYEPNNSIGQARNLTATFLGGGNSASVKTTGSNFHTEADNDYYRINLPSGYDYTIKARLHDSKNSGDGNTYTADGLFSYSIDNGENWSETYDDIMPGNFVVVDGGVVYFHVFPAVDDELGTYFLDITIERKLITDIKNADFADAIKIYPNPANNKLQITGYGLQISTIEMYDIVGKKQNTEIRMRNDEVVIDISHLSAGIYFLKIQTESGTATKKVIKQ